MPRVILDWDKSYKKGVIVSEFLESIRGKFSIPNEGKKVSSRLGKPTWYMPDFISPISNTGRFDVGLYFQILETLKSCPVEYEIITTEALQNQIIQTYSWNNSYDIAQMNLKLRPYQESAIKRSIHMGYGVNIIATAGGKTLIMATLIQTIRNNEQKQFTTLLILPANIVQQTYKEFISYGITTADMSIWNADNEFTKTPIIIVSAETLKSYLATFKELTPKPEYKYKDQGISYTQYLKDFSLNEKTRKVIWNKRRKDILIQLEDVDLVVIDEVHGLRKNNVLSDTLKFFSTRHRFGFTGTLPSDLLDQWNITGHIGPILININSAVLREQGYIAQLKTQILNIHYQKPPRFKLDLEDTDKAYQIECDFLYHSDFRNRVITHLSTKFNKNSLIIVDKIDHGETLERILKQNTDKDVYFVRGSVDMDDREKLRELMEQNNNIICIAMSRIFAVGINIKNLHYIVFAQGGKAKVTIIQSIGRGLRLHEQKECLILIDIADATHYGEKHLNDRLQYYEEERIDYEIKELFE